MKKRLKFLSSLVLIALLTSCASHDLTTPCPDYGRFCSQTPLNNE